MRLLCAAPDMEQSADFATKSLSHKEIQNAPAERLVGRESVNKKIRSARTFRVTRQLYITPCFYNNKTLQSLITLANRLWRVFLP